MSTNIKAGGQQVAPVIHDEQTEFLRNKEGIRLAVTWNASEQGTCDVLILHGLGEHSGRYRWLKRALADAGFNHYAIDLRGHGRSSGERTDIHSFDQYLDDLDVLVQFVLRRNQGRPVFLFGHSMGCLVAAGYVLQHPETVRGLILSAAPFKLANPPSRLKQLISSFLAKILPQFRMKNGFSEKELTRDEDERAAYRADPLVQGDFTLRWGAEFLRQRDKLLAELKELSVPLLVLHGEADRIADCTGTRDAVGTIPGGKASLITYPGMHHELHNEKAPDRAKAFQNIIDWIHQRCPGAACRAPIP